MSYTAIKDKMQNKWIILDCKGNLVESVPTFDSVVDALRYINENFPTRKQKNT
jgi:hypothetical protein